MKTPIAIVLAFLCLIMCSCENTSEAKAEKLIKDALSKTMNDYDSYKPVEYSKLDSSYTFVEGDKRFQKLSKLAKKLTDSAEKVNDDFQNNPYSDRPKDLAIETSLIDSAKHLMQLLTDFKKAFKPQFNGYKMDHSFRGKNANGQIVIASKTFYFDKELSKVTGISDSN